jgi:hypothetical protein
MQHDTLSYDSLKYRPLPKWLIDQKAGLTTIQPQKIVIKEDNSLKISFIVTSVFIILAIAILTFYFFKKHKRQL